MFLSKIVDGFIKLNDSINSVVWGPVMLVVFLSIGVYFTLRLKFFQIRYFKTMIKYTMGDMFSKKKNKNEISPFKAASTALAGTIGTGNIVGVSTAIMIGGVGAVFWMWVSSFFGMMTKYAEIVLSMCYRQRDENKNYIGGPMYYIEKGMHLKWLSILFCVFCVLASFGIGNMTQINSMAQSVNSEFKIDKLIIGIVVSIIVGFVIIGGVNRITNITSIVVPVFGLMYIIGGVIVLIVNYQNIIPAFKIIISNAFNINSVCGGSSGYVILKSIQYGFSRGFFSNEAGLGSAPIAHSASEQKSEVLQGLWGIFEVFFDTIIMCSLTALVIITTDVMKSGESGVILTTLAFEKVFGDKTGIVMAISISFFAFATIIGWCYYGEKCIEYIFKNNKKAIFIYRLFYVLLIIMGAIIKLDLVWNISDTMNGLMAIPNIIALILLSPTVIKKTKEYENKK